MANSLVSMVAAYLGCTDRDALALAQRAPRTYRHYQIPKKKGGSRTIHHPSRQTKAMQYALIELLLRQLPVHDNAIAYRRGIRSPLVANARAHVEFRYSVRVDFTEFFHSIHPEDLERVIESQTIRLSAEDLRFIENCLFVHTSGTNRGLAIGAPSSPLVSNIVMYDLDGSLARLASSTSNPAAYTRYADDVFFSSNVRGACLRFYERMRRILEQTASPRVRINESKTIFSSRGTRRVVTGIFIRPDGGISLGRSNKRYIRKLIFDLQRGSLPPEAATYLCGYLAFVLDVEPDFYNRLSLKYGAEILEQAMRCLKEDTPSEM